MYRFQRILRFGLLLLPLAPLACASNRVATHAPAPLPPVSTTEVTGDALAVNQHAAKPIAATTDQSASPIQQTVGTVTETPDATPRFDPQVFPDVSAEVFQEIDKNIQLTAEEVPPAPIPDIAANSGVRTLSLADLQGMALANNPTIPLANSEVEKERGMREQVGLYPNPTVGYVNSSSSSNGQSQTNGVLFQQTFITAGKLEKAQARESYGIQSTQWQLESQRMRVMNDVRLRYYDVLAAQEQIQVALNLSKLSEQALTAANQLLKGMQVPKTDVLQAEIQNQKIQVALQNAKLEYEAAWHKLAVIIGTPNLQPAPLEAPPDGLPEFNLEQEWQRLLSQSPQLKNVQSQVGLARSQWVVAEAAPIPDITVQFVGQYDSIGNYGTYNSLIALPLPIFNRNQGGIYQASQEYNRSQKEVERVCLVLRDQLVTAYGNYQLAKNRSEQLKSEILPKLQENLELTINGYQQGEYSYLAVVNAQETTFQTNLEYLAALTEARRLAVDIEGLQLTGGLNPASIGTAIQEVGSGGRLRAIQAQQQKQGSAGLGNFAPAALD